MVRRECCGAFITDGHTLSCPRDLEAWDGVYPPELEHYRGQALCFSDPVPGQNRMQEIWENNCGLYWPRKHGWHFMARDWLPGERKLRREMIPELRFPPYVRFYMTLEKGDNGLLTGKIISISANEPGFGPSIDPGTYNARLRAIKEAMDPLQLKFLDQGKAANTMAGMDLDAAWKIRELNQDRGWYKGKYEKRED